MVDIWLVAVYIGSWACKGISGILLWSVSFEGVSVGAGVWVSVGDVCVSVGAVVSVGGGVSASVGVLLYLMGCDNCGFGKVQSRLRFGDVSVV